MKTPEINLNMLFIDLLPTYRKAVDILTEKQKVTKQEFIELFSKTFNTMEPRTNLFLHSIKDSRFINIWKENGTANFE
jgi:hypothetical protein